MIVLNFEIICFFKGFLKLATNFLLIWTTCSLALAKNESFFFLMNQSFINFAVLPVKLRFSGSLFHLVTLLAVHITHYWRSEYSIFEQNEIFKGTDYCFKGFDRSFSKSLFEFSPLLFSPFFLVV